LNHEGGNMAEAKKKAKSLKPKTESKAKQSKKAEVVAETVTVEKAPEAIIEVEKEADEPQVAKAGKRSAKAQREETAKETKAARKVSADDEKSAKKTTKKPTKPRHERAGKKYREAWQQIDKTRTYSLSEAIELALKTAPTKFDSTVELHVNLGVDPKQADQNIRDSLVLPAGTGKSVRVAVLADEDQVKAAVSAGADISDSQALLALLDKEQLDFDVLIATPANMAQLGKYARLLGPRGLMPNPKSGTVTNDIAKAVQEAKAGKVEYRVDQAGIVHLGLGKVSFGDQKIGQNAEAAISSIKTAKPASLKGAYIKSAYLTTTMGPSVRVDIA
jgi:large subunit ribosomal protein L1